MSAVRSLVDWDAPCEVEPARGHEIAFAPQSRVVADSAELGWRDAFASITSRRAWCGRIAPLPHLGVGYCLRGENRIERRLDGEATAQVVAFKPRQIALLPTHTPAQFRVWGDADVLVVYLRAGMVRAVADRLFGASNQAPHFEPVMSFSDPLLEQFCLAFAEALHARRRDETRYVDQLAESAAAHCLMRYPLGRARAARASLPSMETALAELDAYIDANLEGDLGLAALARAARLSPSGLKRALARVHGVSPKQWVIQRRLARAREWLAATDWPLAEIALRAGFSSQSHLCSLFKRAVGRTPNHFRRAL